ncbi:GSCFA domain-containing protein [Parabacteroides bouchesdurhonensis]|uniref:GSCFA domain-containing protein n=1 Tax=Parabacteroides bouchesdurhonensis TaxID=1936995 RepID=UPI000E484F58|nr:GSCFA domain-containing protein [Parabacteroides bouchesdurhonensis]RHJ90846.1 GSCFA domain protein [Bacteroides sp. AM07-16]
MELSTPVSIPKPRFTFEYGNQIMLFGSCFAENIGSKLEDSKFTVDLNPFGTLYNPASVALALRKLFQPERFTGKDLFQHGEIYHSFSHHSKFSSTSEAECLENINERLFASSERLRQANRLVITFGTAYVYKLKENGQIVSNCHKLPEKMFTRELLPVQDIVENWQKLLLSLWEQNPELKVLFTVSPIRHWKDGAHGNQISKATLLLAIEQLQKSYATHIEYFPAYEIMMDELRDYRFYADDMLHPSSLAIEYIWQGFKENYLSQESLAILKEWNDIKKALNHKPFQPESDAYRQFISQTLLKMERISRKIASFDISKEYELVKSKLK